METFLIVIIVLALLFDFINGFHDSANSIATVISTKVLTPVQAVIWAAMFNFLAFFIFKEHGVANTIVDTVKEQFVTLPVVFSGLVGAIVWNLITWWFGIPSSSSHALIGGFGGAAITHAGLYSINAAPVLKIVSFIFIAPVMGLVMAFFISLWFINSFRKSHSPKFVSLGIVALTYLFLSQVMETDRQAIMTSFDSYYIGVIFYHANFKFVLMGLIITVLAGLTFFLNTLNTVKAHKWFKRIQLLTSGSLSLSHGGNDAQKVMGIITAALIAGGYIKTFSEMPVWVPLACYSAISLGTLSGGWKIIKTMGTRITKVTPFEGVAAETAGALTLFITEAFKIPVSTTHTIAGSIMGVGATKRLSAVRWGVTVNLIIAWIITIPISATVAGLVYYVYHFFA